jgi:hypothetical protein
VVEIACPIYSHVCSIGRRNIKPVPCVPFLFFFSTVVYVYDFLAGFDLIYLWSAGH